MTMGRFSIAGEVHTQHKFTVSPGVEVHRHRFYGFNASGQLVKPADAATGRAFVYGLQRATGDAAATTRALCAVSVIAVIPRATLTAADVGKTVYAVDEQSAATTDNGKPCGLLLGVTGPDASILLR